MPVILTEINLTRGREEDEEGDTLDQEGLGCVRETVEDDDDETTDSKGDDGRMC